MTNAQTVDAFLQIYLQAPELARLCAEEKGYSVAVTKIEKKDNVSMITDGCRQSQIHPDPYQFPFMTGERSIATL